MRLQERRRNSKTVSWESCKWRGKAVLETRSSNVEWSIAQVCMGDRSFTVAGPPRLVRVLPTSHVATLDDRSRRKPVAAICHVPRKQAIQCLVNQNGQLKFNTLSHWQSMKLPQNRRNVRLAYVEPLLHLSVCFSRAGLDLRQKSHRIPKNEVKVFRAACCQLMSLWGRNVEGQGHIAKQCYDSKCTVLADEPDRQYKLQTRQMQNWR